MRSGNDGSPVIFVNKIMSILMAMERYPYERIYACNPGTFPSIAKVIKVL